MTLAPGSAPITEVAESRKGYDSDLDARVRGSGRQRTLDYDLGGKGGELEVRLYERGRDVFREIAKLKGGKGDLRFTPAEGEAPSARSSRSPPSTACRSPSRSWRASRPPRRRRCVGRRMPRWRARDNERRDELQRAKGRDGRAAG